MTRSLGKPRSDLIDLLKSRVGQMVARRIDEAYGVTPSPEERRRLQRRAARMVALVREMNRDQLEACDPELDRFFAAMPFGDAIAVAIEIEFKWPHHIDTLPEASRRLNLVRKAGQYATLLSEEKIASIFERVSRMERR
ncbi:hypothetical protein [Trinickia fusca]|uniref:Uncharacterized protein n=1 Tax=Trinickia fusca TaxID=2419777 RepID=A0A494XH99_9BURK|nr:hypothetical protein [Trinickia fusca]RKP47539.1 hypothetical protein D7S89_15030 [Trinickia fusca]